MVDMQALMDMCEQALECSPAAETQLIVASSQTGLTRFANNTIHQNVTESDAIISVQAVEGKRLGVARTNNTSPEGLAACAERAATIARHQVEHPGFPGLADPAEHAVIEQDFGGTADCTPEQRAAAVAETVTVAERDGLAASGAFATEVGGTIVANSHGVRAEHVSASSNLNVTMIGEDSAGRSTAVALRVEDIDAAAVAEVAAAKARDSAGPARIEPGEYTVVLEEDAVAELVEFLGWSGFGAKAVQEQRSFLCGQIGERICGDNITIWDDGLDPAGFALPFDYEGVPRQKVVLIEEGIARGPVHDRTTAAKDGVQSTGHALPPPASWGPFPMHLHLLTGDSSVQEMIRSTERGILVTRFHYTNIVHPIRTELTGMTRDGTFLIEDGQVTRGLRNLRFTQSILEALSNVEMIGRTAKLTEYARIPALKIRNFRFTGTTEF